MNEYNGYRLRPIYSDRRFGAFLMIIGVFCALVIIHRLSYYVYEYDAEFSPVDYGRFNILSYFTVQSNIFVIFYLITLSLAVFGVKRAQKIAFNPITGALVTTYILLTGAIYCCGIPLGMTPPFKWDNPTHSMSSFIQVFHHMIIPPFMFVLWLFPITNQKITYKKAWLFGLYPLAYSLFSIVRGAFSNPTYYPYPFYRPDFIWELFFKDKPMDNTALAYILMLPVLAAGIMLFVAVAAGIIAIHNSALREKDNE